LSLSEEVLQEKQLDLGGHLGYLDIPLYGGHGEAVNTYDCDSYIRGFDPLWPPQKINAASLDAAFYFSA
jgi:hypothetical protein